MAPGHHGLKKQNGFTLVELMVATAIAALLIGALSQLLSGTVHNLFITQQKLDATHSHFGTISRLEERMSALKEIITPASPSDSNNILIRTQTSEKSLPFSFMTKKDDRIAIKDLLIFNDVIKDGNDFITGDSGSGEVKEGNTGLFSPPKNFAGFAKKDDDNYYVALPLEGKVVHCNTSGCDSDPITNSSLSHPVDVEVSGDYVFISDAGNGRVLRIDTGKNKNENDYEVVLAENLNFPAGLAFYDGSQKRLFIADTLANKVYWVSPNLGSGSYPQNAIPVVGEGDDHDCNNIAKDCALSQPTGLVVDTANHALYIADSGNNRILRLRDPGKKELGNYEVPIKYDQDMMLDHLEVTFKSENDFMNPLTISSDTLPTGACSASGKTVTCNMFTTLAEGITIQCTGGDPGPPPGPCTDQPFTKLRVSDPLFDTSTYNQVEFETPAVTFTISSDAVDPDFTYSVSDGNTTPHSQDDKVYIADSLITKNEGEEDNVTINLTDLYTDLPDFLPVTVEIAPKSDPSSTTSQTKILRTGNDILGTPEDYIEVLINETKGLNFPTGIGLMADSSDEPASLLIADSLNKRQFHYTFSDSSTKPGSPINIFSTSTSDIPFYDKISDFEVDEFNFTQSGNRLTLDIEAKIDEENSKEYMLTGKIPD